MSRLRSAVVSLALAGLVASGTGCAVEDEPRGERGSGAGKGTVRLNNIDGRDRAEHRYRGQRGRKQPADRRDKNNRNRPRSTGPTAPRTYLVTRVVDGDTLELGNGETVRIVGIDTPERGDCGYDQATTNLRELVEGKDVTLSVSDEDRDAYDRLLRYVNIGALDAGYRQIRDGFAIARYDSRDGYGFHVREPAYIKADRANPNYKCAPKPPPPDAGGGGGCATGYTPCLPPAPPDLDCADVNGPVQVYGSDPHQLDADGDGVACE